MYIIIISLVMLVKINHIFLFYYYIFHILLITNKHNFYKPKLKLNQDYQSQMDKE